MFDLNEQMRTALNEQLRNIALTKVTIFYENALNDKYYQNLDESYNQILHIIGEYDPNDWCKMALLTGVNEKFINLLKICQING